MFHSDLALELSPFESTARIGNPFDARASIGGFDVVLGGLEVDVLRVDRPLERTNQERERRADAQQDLLEGLEGDLRRADADRTLALIAAFEASMEDLAGRFGEQHGRRESLGAQSFFQSIGLRLGMSPLRVAHLLVTAIVLRDRLPRTWAAYLDGHATWRAADLAASEANGLDDEHRPAYDEQAAVAVVATPASRLKARLRTIRARLQDDTAEPRAERTHAMRRVTVDTIGDSGASITATGPAIPIVGFDQALTKAAIAAKLHDGETRTVGQLRFDIMQDLLVEGIKQSADPAWDGLTVPTRKGVVPAPILTIPALAALGRTTEQARLHGYGPVALEAAKQLAGSAKSFVRVLSDPFTGVRIGMDQTMRTPPPDMRRWVVVRDELCRFPGCNRPAHLCDVDHIAEWQDGGVTDVGNLVSLSRPHHRAKSAGLWQEVLERNGSVDRMDPWGNHFADPPPDAPDPAPMDLVEGDPRADDCPF